MSVPLPPWIRSIKRPLDRLARPRRSSFEDLPDTEPGEELGSRPRGLRHDALDDEAAPAADGTEPWDEDR